MDFHLFGGWHVTLFLGPWTLAAIVLLATLGVALVITIPVMMR